MKEELKRYLIFGDGNEICDQLLQVSFLLVEKQASVLDLECLWNASYLNNTK
jgi:hypothetical protein